jgi:hypothetical protein
MLQDKNVNAARERVAEFARLLGVTRFRRRFGNLVTKNVGFAGLFMKQGVIQLFVIAC